MRALRPSSKTRAHPCTYIAIHRYNTYHLIARSRLELAPVYQ